jgi:patatin-like phospholipase
VAQYSPERRTALVLCGTGVHGAYHAGVLRALQEAGVKIDIMAGQGVGAAAATLAALDGGGKLSDADGLWRTPQIARLYGWKWSVRAAGWLAAFPGLILLTVLVAGAYLPLAILRAAILLWALLVATLLVAVIVADRRTPARRRSAGGWWWRIVGAPLDAQPARNLFTGAIRQLVQGGRYSDVLRENVGQPGFRELMLIATDLDARRDVVAAMLGEPYRREFLAPRPGCERRAEALDLAAPGPDYALELVGAALTPPLGCDPKLVTFAPDSFWRGETHRMCDRPGAVSRLIEELAAAGASQAVIVSAVPHGLAPHRLGSTRLDLRNRLSDYLAAAEVAALRDAMEMARLRFDAVYLICPAHNPVGAFGFGGAYDEASDRRQDVPELMERASEDAYRQFIEPVVGASGEHLAVTNHESRSTQGVFDTPHPPR